MGFLFSWTLKREKYYTAIQLGCFAYDGDNHGRSRRLERHLILAHCAKAIFISEPLDFGVVLSCFSGAVLGDAGGFSGFHTFPGLRSACEAVHSGLPHKTVKTHKHDGIFSRDLLFK